MDPSKAVETATKNSWGMRGFVAVAAIYFLSFAFPAYQPLMYGSKGEVYYGLAAFLLGPIGLFAGHLSWLANPLLWMSWRQSSKGNRYIAFSFAAVSLGMALTFLLSSRIAIGSAGEFPFQIKIGYWIWVASIALTCFATVSVWGRHKQT